MWSAHPLEAARDGDLETAYCYAEKRTGQPVQCVAPGAGAAGMQMATTYRVEDIVAIQTNDSGGCSIGYHLTDQTNAPYQSRIIFYCQNEGLFRLNEFHYCVSETAPISPTQPAVPETCYLPLILKEEGPVALSRPRQSRL